MYLICDRLTSVLDKSKAFLIERQLKYCLVYERDIDGREERNGEKGSRGERKGKIEREKRRRKIKEMRQLSLGCRARNKDMICIRTAWAFIHYTCPGPFNPPSSF